jgi:hypothetical protein
MAYEYYKLMDLAHLNTIGRTDGPIEHRYAPGEGWVRSTLMLDYFCDESDVYDMYSEIAESEALAIVGEGAA